jgi:hypothetical protein
MANTDTRKVRAPICHDGLTREWMGGEWEDSACIGCAGCDPQHYATPAQAAAELAQLRAARVEADRAWIATQAAAVQARYVVEPMTFRAS